MSGARTLVLWVGIVAAPLAWLGQLLLGYEAVEGGCSEGGGAGDVFGVGTESTAVVVTIVALVLAGAGLLAGLNTWRAGPEPRSYVRFLGFAGFLGSALLLATILLAGAGVLALDPCAQS